MSESSGAQRVSVLIIGAGAGGLCMAARLRSEGFEDFVMLEKSEGVGGTWRDNSYPDAACDVPSHFYSFSFAPNPDWSRKWAKQPEILEYFEGLVDRFSLAGNLRLETEVAEAVWSDADCRWSVRTTHGDTYEADVVVSGLGQLNMPHVPDIEGLADFGGTVFHSARWDHDHDLAGERVGVIGVGASAIQFVPPVVREAAHTTLFQRSANYVAPKPDREFKAWERWAFRNIPGVNRAYRFWIWAKLEARFSLMRRNSALGRMLAKRYEAEVSKMASDQLPVDALVPDYPPGCKRVLIADDWFPAITSDSAQVVTDDVVGITSDGVDTADGRHFELDTIIFGTGFRSTEFLTPLKITGSGGRDLNEAWGGGAVAYLGLSVAGFPNMFMLYGPNTNLGHNSILFMIEQQVDYVLAAMEQLRRRGAMAIDVTEGALTRWDEEIVRRSKETVWSADCTSWYKDDEGRITNNWIGHTTEYRRRMRSPKWEDWRFVRCD
ncbi:MAG: flavin-containing monooxygenase [Microthrixaceae bacterium]